MDKDRMVCEVCGGTSDGYLYEPDEEDVGLPDRFMRCATCMSPILEIENKNGKRESSKPSEAR